MGGAGQKRGLSASAVGDLDRSTGLQLKPGTNARVGNRFAIPTIADQRRLIINKVFFSSRSAGEQRDGKMVEPGTLEICHTEQPFEASKLVRTRTQRIPSRSRAWAQSKTGYICADPTAIFTFRLQHGGGPYIPYCRAARPAVLPKC